MCTSTQAKCLLAATVAIVAIVGCTSSPNESRRLQLVEATGELRLPSDVGGEARELTVEIDDARLAELADHPLAYAATVHWLGDADGIALMHGVLRLVDGCVVGLQRPEDGGITHLLFNPVNYRWDEATRSIIRRSGYGDNSVTATWRVPDGSIDEEYHGNSPDERYLGNLQLSTPLEMGDLLAPTHCDTGPGTTWVYVD